MRWVELRQDEVFEGDSNHSLCMKPPIRNYTDKILRRKWLKYWNSEHKTLHFPCQYLKKRYNYDLSSMLDILT